VKSVAANPTPRTWKQSAGWAAHDSPAKAVAFAGAEFGQCLACSFADGSIKVWREVGLYTVHVESS
jgi:hypothetical protein